MRIPRQAKITRKVMLGFLPFITIFLLFGVVSMFGLDKVSNLTQKINDHPLIVSNAALQANISITKMHRSMKDIVIFHASSDIHQIVEEVSLEEIQVYLRLDTIKNNILGEEGKVLEDEARSLFAEWLTIRNEVIELANNDQIEDAADITIGIGADHAALLDDKMLELTRYARIKASEFTRETEKVHSRVKLISILLLLAGILISLLVALYTIRGATLSEKKLLQGEERYRSLIETQTDLVCRFTPDGKFVFVNDRYCQFFNKPKKEIIGTYWQPMPVDDDIEFVNEKLSKMSSTNPTIIIENRVRSGKGEIIWAQFINQGIYNERGELLEIQSVGRDITKRKEAEIALQESADTLKQAQSVAKIGSWWYDTTLQVSTWTDEMFYIFGFDPKPEPFPYEEHKKIIHPEDWDRFDAAVVKAGTEGVGYNLELRIIRPDGEIRHINTICSAKKNNEGVVTQLVGTTQDITERKYAEEEHIELLVKLQQSQKMESIGNLAGGIAHDFNNILSSIMGFTELSLDEVEKGSIQEDNLQEVYTAGKRAKDLVSQMLVFARQSEEELKPIRVDTIATEVLKFSRASIPATVEIRQNIQANSIILGNATQIYQMLLNLITNAAHAMEENGGILDFSLNKVDLDGSISQEKMDLLPGHYIEIKVSDTGAGIAPEIIESIFDPYFTTKGPGEGTGLGLAMAHGIVESYGGMILVDSESGQGTLFTIYLPETRVRQAQLPHQSETLPSGSDRILFVDDEAALARLGGQMLNQLGYRVTTRTSSIEALELFRFRPDDFDLVITDMTMPNMTGDKLAIELMKIRPDIPVVICTGYSNKMTEETASEIGIKGFAYKPVIRAGLAKTIRNLLDGNKEIQKQS